MDSSKLDFICNYLKPCLDYQTKLWIGINEFYVHGNKVVFPVVDDIRFT